MRVVPIKGIPEPDATAKHIFVASMMHTSMRSPILGDTPDFPDSERRKEVVHHEQIPDQPMSKQKKNASDKKSSFTIKAKSIPVTPKTVASSRQAASSMPDVLCSQTIDPVSSTVQAQVVGTGRCLLCSNRGEDSAR